MDLPYSLLTNSCCRHRRSCSLLSSIINSTVTNFLLAVFSHTSMVISLRKFLGNGISAELWTSSFTLLQIEEEEDLGDSTDGRVKCGTQRVLMNGLLSFWKQGSGGLR